MAKNVDHKGRRAEPRHIRLYHTVTGSAAWADLSGAAVKLLIALLRHDKGGHNGELFMSVRHAAKSIGVSLNTAAKAFRELDEHGFIKPTAVGHFKVKAGPATSWRVTWMAAPGHCGPTRDFERWQPVGNKTRSQNSTETVSKIDTAVGNDPLTVSNNNTIAVETRLVSVDRAVSNIDTQIVCHGHVVSRAVSDGGNTLKTTAADFSNAVGADLLDELRGRVRAHINDGAPGTQTRLAASASIPGGTLSKFLMGRGLARPHFISLQLALVSANKRKAA